MTTPDDRARDEQDQALQDLVDQAQELGLYEQTAARDEQPAPPLELPAVLVARCMNYREADDELCTGRIRFRWGQSQAACDTCGGYCGIAVAAWERVEGLSTAAREIPADNSRRIIQAIKYQRAALKAGDDEETAMRKLLHVFAVAEPDPTAREIPATTTQDVRDRAAQVMATHYLTTDDLDADRHAACICGRWREGDPSVVPGWDDHLADVLDEAGLLAPPAREIPADEPTCDCSCSHAHPDTGVIGGDRCVLCRWCSGPAKPREIPADELAEAERWARHLADHGIVGHWTTRLMAEYDRRGAIEQRARSFATDRGDSAEGRWARYILGES